MTDTCSIMAKWCHRYSYTVPSSRWSPCVLDMLNIIYNNKTLATVWHCVLQLGKDRPIFCSVRWVGKLNLTGPSTYQTWNISSYRLDYNYVSYLSTSIKVDIAGATSVLLLPVTEQWDIILYILLKQYTKYGIKRRYPVDILINYIIIIIYGFYNTWHSSFREAEAKETDMLNKKVEEVVIFLLLHVVWSWLITLATSNMIAHA